MVSLMLGGGLWVLVILASSPYSSEILSPAGVRGQNLWTDFRKKILKFRENPSSGSLNVPFGRTDRHDEANSPFFRSFAKAPPKTDTIQRVSQSPHLTR